MTKLFVEQPRALPGSANYMIGTKVTATLMTGWIESGWVELHRKGSATAACAAGLLILNSGQDKQREFRCIAKCSLVYNALWVFSRG